MSPKEIRQISQRDDLVQKIIIHIHQNIWLHCVGFLFQNFNKLKIHLCGRELSLLERDPTIIAVMLLTFLLKVFN